MSRPNVLLADGIHKRISELPIIHHKPPQDTLLHHTKSKRKSSGQTVVGGNPSTDIVQSEDMKTPFEGIPKYLVEVRNPSAVKDHNMTESATSRSQVFDVGEAIFITYLRDEDITPEEQLCEAQRPSKPVIKEALDGEHLAAQPSGFLDIQLKRLEAMRQLYTVIFRGM